ncbi:MAG: XdhC family protein, partial [Ktedonobacterales bacterium]
PEGAEMVVGEIAPFLEARAPDPMSAVVIVTRGHRSDHEALTAALATHAGYVGMIGSPSKVRNIFTALAKTGVSDATLARIHAPIGLDLGGQTPDEIALSIAAELVAWRHGGSAQPLHTRHHLLTKEPAKTATG